MREYIPYRGRYDCSLISESARKAERKLNEISSFELENLFEVRRLADLLISLTRRSFVSGVLYNAIPGDENG